MSEPVEVWINSNKLANDEPLMYYHDVEVNLDDEITALFECRSEKDANKLKAAIENYALSATIN